MQIFLNLKDVPELAQLSPEERTSRWRRVYWKSFRHLETWGGVLALAAGSSLGSWLGGRHGHAIIGSAVGGYLGGLVLWNVAVDAARRHYWNRPERDEAS